MPDSRQTKIVSRRLKVLVVGPHPMERQASMKLYAHWIVSALEGFAGVQLFQTPSVFLTRRTNSLKTRKYFFYIDQFIILSVLLFFMQARFDVVIIGDHSNAPSSFLVAERKLVIMVHDSIAIRAAFGTIPDYDRIVGFFGVMLQRLIVVGLRRARAILSNPGPLSQELRELGVTAPITVLGCPLDISRLKGVPAKQPVKTIGIGRFALYVGSDAGRKRKDLLVNIWASDALKWSGYSLVLAGFTSEANKRLFEQAIPNRLICVDDASDAELGWLYDNCLCLITASAHEGFCIPVLEAASFEKCVITPENPFYVQVFGKTVHPVLRFDGGDAERVIEIVTRFNPVLEEGCRRELLERYSFKMFTASLRDLVSSIALRAH
jgi:Glycosyl transferases group 1